MAQEKQNSGFLGGILDNIIGEDGIKTSNEVDATVKIDRSVYYFSFGIFALGLAFFAIKTLIFPSSKTQKK